MSKKTIGLFVGSLRKAANSKSITRFIQQQSNDEFSYEIIHIGELPLYNQDYDDEGQVPAAYTTFRDRVKTLDGFLFITPEYNRSVPAVLKNALDVGSRPYGHSVWAGKAGAIISNSPGNIGGFGANHHLRQSLVFLDVLTLMQPEAYLSHIANALDPKGEVNDSKTTSFLIAFLKAFESWVLKVS